MVDTKLVEADAKGLHEVRILNFHFSTTLETQVHNSVLLKRLPTGFSTVIIE
jgi:hypothetical protein